MSRWKDEIRRRLAAANLDPAREAEIAQELEQHLEDRYAEMRALGRSDDEAARAAIDELREDIRMRDELRRAVSAPAAVDPPGTQPRGSGFANAAQDVRYAARMLRRSPAFTLVSVLTLALGIGGTVAIFSAVYTVLYRPMGVADGAQLVVPVSVNPARSQRRGSIPYADYADWREQRDVFEQVALFNPIQVDIAGGDTPERVEGVQVTEEYFPVMRVQPLLGRVLAPADHDAKAPRVVVISEGLWKRRFGADPAIAGQSMRLGGNVLTIAGVVPSGRLWPTTLDVWLPLRPSLLNDDVRTRRDNMIFLAIARLGPSVPLGQARARVAAIADRVAQQDPASRKGWSTDLIPLREYIVEPEIRLGMFVLLAGVGAVLLIACVNLASLLLVRGTERAREMAVRSALGASRLRLLRQMMTESLVLAFAGGAAGLLLARWLVQGLKAAATPDLPMIDTLTIDRTAAVVAAGITVGTAVLFGLLPALASSTFQPADALREGGRTAGAGRRTGRLRDALVIAQIALAIVLLTGAGLMLRSFVHLTRLDPGVDVERILVGRISLPGARYRQAGLSSQFFERLSTRSRPRRASRRPPRRRTCRLAAVALVSVGCSCSRGSRNRLPATTTGRCGTSSPPTTSEPRASACVRGRAFDRTDREDSRPVMIINETMARRVFGSDDPIGRKLRSWRDENVLREIVGVVSDVRYSRAWRPATHLWSTCRTSRIRGT